MIYDILIYVLALVVVVPTFLLLSGWFYYKQHPELLEEEPATDTPLARKKQSDAERFSTRWTPDEELEKAPASKRVSIPVRLHFGVDPAGDICGPLELELPDGDLLPLVEDDVLGFVRVSGGWRWLWREENG